MIRGAGNVSVFGSNESITYDVRGSFLSHGEYQTAPWLSELPSLSMIIDYYNDEFRLSGGYTINGKTVYFDLSLGECSTRNGSILVRDPSGGWWTWARLRRLRP